MEPCLACGSTTSSAGAANDTTEKFADRFIGLAVRAGDVAALHELAIDQLGRIGGFGHKTGASPPGPSSLYKLRRIRVAMQAMQSAKDMLEPTADDIHRFDHNGHLQ
jgi:hypothetical protein